MSEIYRRRIRVEGTMKAINGYMLTVQDADTGEKILDVTSIDLHLSATGLNTATVTYYEHDESGKLVAKDDKPVSRTGETDNPDVAITALETMTELEQLRAEVQMYRDATIGRIQRRRKKEDGLREVIQHALDDARVGRTGKPLAQISDSLMQAIHEYMQE